jgi:hypothetical protein
MGRKRIQISPETIRLNSDVACTAAMSAFENGMLDEVANPFSSGASWREPLRTQIPAVTDRKPGMCSVTTVMPLGSRVKRTSSIMNAKQTGKS